MALYSDPRFQALMGQTWRPGGERLTRHGVELCAWPPAALVADVGCGPGGTARLLRTMGYRVLAFDRHVVDQGRAVDVVAAHACALPLPDASLDGVVCECVLSLLPEPERALRESFRVLRPGGRALISDLTALADTSRRDNATGHIETFGAEADPPSCADGAMPPERLSACLVAAGFRLLVVEDHRAALRELAAQLLWRGMACGCRKALGYQLWIVEKNGDANHA